MEAPWPPWSTDEFLTALRDFHYPDGKIAIVECEGTRVRTLLRPHNRAASRLWSFIFYLEPLTDRDARADGRVPYLGDVVVAVTPANEPGPSGARPCPFVRWSQFTSWEDFLAKSVSRPGIDSPRRVLAKARKLERELGPLELKLIDRDPEVFEAIITWKLDQLGRFGNVSRLAFEESVRFYRELWRRDLFTASSLRAGGRLVGGKLCYRSNGRHLSRVTVYDNDLRRFSPGSILRLEALKASFEAGDSEFDFLSGGEAQKFTYATHVRWLGSVGREPTIDRLRRRGRMRVALAVARYPRAYRRLRRFEQQALALPRRLRR